MGSRNPEKEMFKNLTDFEAYVKMTKAAIKSDKTKLKKFREMKVKLETSYFSLNQSFHFYRADVIANECKTETAFNGKEEDSVKDSYMHNDTWSDSQFAKFIEVTESIEDKIDELEIDEFQSVKLKPAVVEEKIDHLEAEVMSEKSSLRQSIAAFIGEVNDVSKIAISAASSMEKFLEKLKVRLKILVQKSRKVGDVLRGEVNDFYDTDCAELDSALLQICTKLEIPELSTPPPPHTTSGTSTPASSARKEQVYLEKSKPPRFRGDEVEFPEFKRKWLSIVSKANLPEESEIDKLRDSLPADSKD